MALLAATANVLVSKTALLIRTGSLSSAVPRPVTSPLVSVPTMIPAVHRAEAPAVTADPRDDELLVAVDGFEWVVRRRVENSSKTANEYQSATAKLRDAYLAFVKRSSGAPNAAGSGALDTYLKRGAAVVRLGDQARDARQEYIHLTSAMDDRAGATLDHAWHVFGRVIARQSLMKLHADVGVLRQRGEQLYAAETLEPKEESSLAAAEAEVAKDLGAQRAVLASAQGTPWLADMMADLAALTEIRARFDAYARDSIAATEEFDRSRLALSMQIKSARRAAQSRPETPPSAAPIEAAAAINRPAAAQPAASLVLALPHETTAQLLLAQADPRARALMATVTAALLLVIAGICIGTVRSVLVPVRRILRATHRLAHGEPHARVIPGGIRELATLAVAFNDMAQRLEAAQESARRQHEELEARVVERTHKLKQLAESDPLTSLPNRRHLSETLSDAIRRAALEGATVGVYFLDIDNFKNYNDSLGHVFGDRVLMSVGNRLEEITDGKGFVARFGGDEFTVVCVHSGGLESVREFGLTLADGFHQLLPVDERELRVSVSVGASAFPMHADDADGLLKAADSALFRAKELGRSQLVVFTSSLAETAAARFSTEQGLRRALEQGDFELLFQPEIDLATFDVALVEALLRWRMPDGRLVPPGEFLSVAEQSGLIIDINDWVLRTAMEQAAEWHHGEWPDARVAVNVTPRQLLDERFTDRVLGLLREFRIPPGCIELELTESVLQTGPGTLAVLSQLQAHGIRIALDDFGTGYSSLTSLEQLPLSRIKIDRSLIVNVDTSPRSASIAKAILDLCAGLHLEVTVEGIERHDQLVWLLEQRNVFLQGFLISVPVSSGEVLPIRAFISEKMQDLLLSTRAKASTPPPVEAEHSAVRR